MKDEVKQLKEKTFPELRDQVTGLKQATRDILDLLRPELLELPAKSVPGPTNTEEPDDCAADSPTRKVPDYRNTSKEDALKNLPELPSSISEGQQDSVMPTWVAPRAPQERGPHSDKPPSGNP